MAEASTETAQSVKKQQDSFYSLKQSLDPLHENKGKGSIFFKKSLIGPGPVILSGT